MACRPVLVLLASIFAGPPIPAQTTVRVEVDVVVRDASGRPVPGVEFWDRWTLANGDWKGSMMCPEQESPLRSDVAGRVRGVWRMGPGSTPLFGMTSDRSRGVLGVCSWERHEARVRGELVLEDVVRLRAELRSTIDPSVALAPYVFVVDPDSARRFEFELDARRSELPILAPSNRAYRLFFRLGSGRAAPRTIVWPDAAPAVVDLGPITVPSSPLDRIGEVLPDWPTTEAACAPRAIRGKPALLAFSVDFYGWKEPVLALEALARHPRRDAFHVLMFDIATEPARSVLTERFPTIRVAPEQLREVYGSERAVLVLDARGRLVRCGGAAECVQALERLLAEDAAVPEDRPRDRR